MNNINDKVNNFLQNISNISYTNKDFRSIYPELLDLVKVLTDKWDPSISNESDPGDILLKLNALIADKNNYNIDKNILEAFPLSVTQTGNARKIYDLLAYKMKWYHSATTEISFTNLSGKGTLKSSDGNILNQFDTITDDSGEVVYTLLGDLTQLEKNSTQSIEAIEGNNYEYELNGNTTINFNNLDTDLRLFFNESRIAENGIFIRNVQNGTPVRDFWTKVDNIASYSAEKTDDRKVYEFGVLPNSDTCYIQFPEDISSLIGDGLNIRYIVSSGIKGNIKPFTLNTPSSTLKLQLSSTDTQNRDTQDSTSDILDYLSITNPDASTGGADPEGLNEAYKNYKKTAGTFDTLVTCRDYQNWLYLNEPDIISNLVVSDRTNDIGSKYLQTIQNGEPYKKFLGASYKDEKENTQSMNAFNICIYPLKASQSIYDKATFNTTFTPDNSLVGELQTAEFEDVSSIQHDYIANYDTTYLFKNKLHIKCKIITYNKVTTTEGKDIIKNIWSKLYTTYNGREVEFGYSLDYNDLVATIESADSRIKTAVLDLTNYTTVSIDSKGKESNSLDITNLVSNMVLSGNVQLCKIDDSFNRDFYQQNSGDVKNIKTITTEFTIPKNTTSSGTLLDNQNIQLICPSYKEDTVYGLGVKFTLNTSNQINPLKGNQIYEVGEGKDITSISFTWTDSNNSTQNKSLTSGKIRVNKDLTLKEDNSHNLISGETLSVIEEVSVSLNSADIGNKLCYWITNTKNSDNKSVLFTANSTERVLDINEYFLYTNTDLSGLVIMGSGTKITRSEESKDEIAVPSIDISSVMEQGTRGVDINYWINSSNIAATVTVQEMELVSFGKGSEYALTKLGSDLNNNWHSLTGEESITIDGTTYDSSKGYSVRTRLNLVASKNKSQTLGVNEKVILYKKDVKYTEGNPAPQITSGQTLNFNTPINLQGGEDLDVGLLNDAGNIEYTLSCYYYTKDTNENNPKRGDNGLITLEGTTTLSCDIKGSTSIENSTIIPLYYEGDGTVSIETNDEVKNDLMILNTNSGYTNQVQISSKGNYFISVLNANSLTFTFGTGNLSIGTFTKFNGFNKDEIGIPEPTSKTNPYSTILSSVNSTEYSDIEGKKGQFNWSYVVPEENKVLNPSSPDAFWDKNHIYNRFTIPQIDVDNSLIEIASISKA